MSLLGYTAFAQTFSNIAKNPGLSSLLGKIMNIIVIPLVQLLFAVTIVIFFWGLFNLISKGDDPKARAEGQKHIMWGVIGMAIMVSVYGIIRVIGNTVGVDPFS